MITESEGKHTTDNMLRTAVSTSRNKYMQQYPKLLLHRFKNHHDIYMAMCSSSGDNDNPQNLPHLPVPDLKKTLEKYLISVKPLVTDAEFQCTRKIVDSFGGPCGPGKNLQEYLIQRAEEHTNWLSKWWLDTAYLSYRDPVTIYSSPGQTFPFTKFESQEDRLKYAAKLIMATLTYKKLIDKKEIPVDRMGKFELDMKQYEKILGTCRIPATPKDELEYYPKSKHIIIAHNNHFFKITVLTGKGEISSEKQLIKQMEFCLAQSVQPGPGVGLLTSQYRDKWSDAYAELIEDSDNKESARQIQRSLFLVCFDKPTCPSPDNKLTAAMKQFIHGGNSTLNSGNRWYDKTIQFVLSPFGEVGLTYEHSPSEGQPVAVMVDFLNNYIKNDMGEDTPDAKKYIEPVRLNFNLSSSLKKAIDAAGKNINKLAINLDLTCFKYDKYGKEFVKGQKMSPDSYIQMAIQTAFYKIHRKPAAHYESAATRIYVGGRTETIRSCSCAAVAFSRALVDPDEEPAEKAKALRAAVASHKKYTIDAIQGLGVDRHMLGLRIAAGKLKMPLPKIFEDVAWKRSSHMRLSTSQVATKCDGLMGYAPLVKDGYGCCYNPRADDINFSVSAFEDYPNTGAIKFKDSLIWCLDEMKKVLCKVEKSKL